MELAIKDILLYDRERQVQGYVRCRHDKTRRSTRCTINVGHNLDQSGLVLAMDYDGRSHVFNLDNGGEFMMEDGPDLTREVFTSIIGRRPDGELEILASGIINMNQTGARSVAQMKTRRGGDQVAKPLCSPASMVPSISPIPKPDHQTAVAREVDELLRKVCSYESDGETACAECPYRDSFFFKIKKQA